jgi:hypothetical protein
MALDETAKLANVKDSIKKFFVDNVARTENKKLTFDKALSVPKIQGDAPANEWVSVRLGDLTTEVLSTQYLSVYVCTRQDGEGFKLSRLRDVVFNYLSDSTQTDGFKRIPLYRSDNWTSVGNFLVTEVFESGDMEGADETKYRILTCTLRWAAKV